MLDSVLTQQMFQADTSTEVWGVCSGSTALSFQGHRQKTDHPSKDIKYKPKAASVRNTLGETIQANNRKQLISPAWLFRCTSVYGETCSYFSTDY